MARTVKSKDLRRRMHTQLFLSAIRVEECLLILTIVRFERFFDPNACIKTQNGDNSDEDETKYTCNNDNQRLSFRIDEVGSDASRRR